VDRVNFSRGRVRPSMAIDASAGINIARKNLTVWSIEADGENLTNRVNLIDFGGLFSGNAVAPPRSYSLRVTMKF
jgi:outer membrane receptor protein involved in Fe transport